MKDKTAILFGLALLFSAPGGGVSADTNVPSYDVQRLSSPEDVVRYMYDPEKDGVIDPSFHELLYSVIVDMRFTEAFAALAKKLAPDDPSPEKTNQCLDGLKDRDPLIGGPEGTITEFIIHPAEIQGGDASVLVEFRHLQSPRRIEFPFKLVEGVWKLDDIIGGDGAGSLQRNIRSCLPGCEGSH